MHIDPRGLHREVLILHIEEVDQTRVLEILNIVHGRRTAETDLLGNTTYVQRTRRISHQNMEQFAQLMQASHIDLLNHQYIHLQLAVHHLQQRCLERLGLQIRRIIAVIEIGLEIFQRLHALAYLAGDRGVMLDNILEGIRMEPQTCLQVQILTEGEPTQVIGLNDILEIVILFINRHDRRSTEDDMQVFVLGVTAFELL